MSKYFKLDNGVLSNIHDKCDDVTLARKINEKYNTNYCMYQVYEYIKDWSHKSNIHLHNFDTYYHVAYSVSGSIVGIVKLNFNDENKTISINDNEPIKLDEKGYNYKYTYRILKTKINVISYNAFKTFIIDTMRSNSAFNISINSVLDSINIK